jgi:hypothetical protein
MSHTPKYVEAVFRSQGWPAVAAGKLGRPDVVTKGGVKAVGKIVCTGNHVAGDTFTFNGVTFTCMASGASGELQYNVDTTLSASLDALITKLNACTDPRVSYATYSKTDTNTAVTTTSDYYRRSDDFIVISSTHSTVVVTQPTGGWANDVNLDTYMTLVNLPGATTETLYLPDGDEGQIKFIAMIGSGTINLTGAHLPGSTTNYALNGADFLALAFAGAKWRLLLNDGAVAT